jgi:ACS family glucarate transporter-like MFS transporter
MPKTNTRSYRVGIVVLLVTSTIINSFDRASLSVAAPFIIKEFGITAAVMGVALSAFFWTYVVGNLFGGMLVDRFGAKKVLGASLGIWSIFSGFTGFASNITHIMIARLGVGVGEGPSFPCVAKVIGGNFPTEEKGTAIGTNAAGARIGLALCPLLMVFLISTVGWRVAFFITGFGAILWVVFWWIFFVDLSATASAAPAADKPKAEKIAWSTLLTNKAILGLIVVKFTQDFLQWMFLTWIPGYLVTGRGFSALEMGFYTSLAFGVAAVAQPIVGFLSDWLIRIGWSITRARKTVQLALQLLSATIIITGWTSHPGIAMCFMVLAIAAESTCAGHIWTIITDIIPSSHIGSVSGLINAIGAIAGIISPIVTGYIVTVTGNFQLALTLGGCSILIASVFLIFVVPSLDEPWHDHLGLKPAAA